MRQSVATKGWSVRKVREINTKEKSYGRDYQRYSLTAENSSDGWGVKRCFPTRVHDAFLYYKSGKLHYHAGPAPCTLPAFPPSLHFLHTSTQRRP